ncbi:MAG: hypothetical protein ABR915_13550 [Thermoguttaceae bacterium]|jgi:hypothetical protein
MPRKPLNRKELREENDAAERQEGETEAPAKEVKEKKPPAKRKSRAKVVKEVRLKAFWGVFSQTLRRVALFEYSQRAEADKKAADLSESQRTPHFVQLVKEVIET